jgi:hypothetical protein
MLFFVVDLVAQVVMCLDVVVLLCHSDHFD